MKAYKQAKADPAAGPRRWSMRALKLATGVPLSVAEKAHEVARITQSLFSVSNPNMKSDLTTAQALARAAITGALANVEINLGSLKDQAFAAEVRKRVENMTV